MALILGTSLACKQPTAGLVSDSPRAIRTTIEIEMVDLSFRPLEVFAQVVECGSFRGATERRDTSQVSVSAHVSSLEEPLGTQLFQRKRGATARLTAAGESVHRRERELLQGRADLCLSQHHG
jgi:molybdenum-dependent DNA-binding transcriptional regulator ModE